MRTKSIALDAMALAAAGCKRTGETTKFDTAGEEQAIRTKETAWMDAYNKHDAAALASQYEDSGSLASAGTALMTDAAARSAFLAGFTADPALKVDFASDRIIIARSGDL